MTRIKDYPAEWPRSLDFIPLLGLQSVIDKELRLYHCDAQVSVQEGRVPRQDIPTEHGVLRVDVTTTGKIRYEFGNPESRDGIELSPEEILIDATGKIDAKYLGKFPDIIIKSRGVVEKIPKYLENEEPFQGAEDIFYLQRACGNWTHKMRKMTGLMFRDFYEFIKSDIMAYLNLSPYHDIFKQKKIRSALKTGWLYTDASGGDLRGYYSLGREGIFKLEKALTKDKWWQDIGLVHPIETRIDHAVLQGNIYRLWRRGELIIV